MTPVTLSELTLSPGPSFEALVRAQRRMIEWKVEQIRQEEEAQKAREEKEAQTHDQVG